MSQLHDLYEKDFYAWIIENAKLIRENRLSELDVENLAEEIECMGRTEKRELLHRLIVLIMHLLKWKFQPQKQSKSWRSTIWTQRRDLLRLLQESPSLKHILQERLIEAYDDAVIQAVCQTSLPQSFFPTKCPFTWEQIFDENFWPSQDTNKKDNHA